MLFDVNRPQMSKEVGKSPFPETIELVLDRGLDMNAEADNWGSTVDASN